MSSPTPPDDATLDATLFALSSGMRRRMLDVLKLTPGCTLTDLCSQLDADIGRFAVMKHLTVLERGGLVISEREGRTRRLWFDPTPIQLIHERWTDEFSVIWASSLTRLKYAAEDAEVVPIKRASKDRRRA